MNALKFQEDLIQFSSSIYGVLDNTESICISPYSVTAAFMLVMIGAAGRSREQISSAFFKNSYISEEREILREYRSLNRELMARARKDVIIATANRLFVNRNYYVKPLLRRRAWYYFRASIDRKDFSESEQTAEEINRWVSKQTRGKITDLVKAEWINQSTVLVLINALYFKGTWETEFNPKNTMKGTFYVTKHRTIDVKMMTMNTKIPYVVTKTYSAISLPYKGNNFDMVFILPREIDGLSKLESEIKRESGFFSKLGSSLKARKLNIYIPKFVIKSVINLKEELPKLGVTDIFSSGKADFSRLVKGSTKGIFVSQAVHKVYIEVDEKGTEGTAATGVKFSKGGGGFKADHPFLFYIRDVKTSVILFIGRYKPS